MDDYGADGVRMGMLLSAPAGNDILFDEKLCQNGLAFCNKIWNAFRLVKGWNVVDETPSVASRQAVTWFDAKIKASFTEIEDLYDKYRLSEALMAVFKLFTDEFSGWYLEMIKPAYGSPIDKQTYDATLRFFEIMMKLIHPFMPFITEEIYQQIYERKEGESIMTDMLHLDSVSAAEEELLSSFETMKQIVSGVRAVRNSKNIAPKEMLALEIIKSNPVEALNDLIKKMANVSDITVVDSKTDGRSTFMVGTTEYAVPIGNLIDADAEISKLEAELKHLEGFLAGVVKKLSNERFVSNAPEQVVQLERKKQQDAETKIATIKASFSKLKK
jgi:valyl-tRNA synthetase